MKFNSPLLSASFLTFLLAVGIALHIIPELITASGNPENLPLSSHDLDQVELAGTSMLLIWAALSIFASGFLVKSAFSK